MPYAAALSEHPVPAEAAGEVIGAVLEQLGPAPELATVFVTAPLAGALEDIGRSVRTLLAPRVLLGGTAVSVAGGAREVEETAAISLWAGSPPGAVDIRAVALGARPDGDGELALTGAEPLDGAAGTLLLLADPFSFPVDELLERLGRTAPELRVLGGLASAARGPGGNRLLLGDHVRADGAVGALVPPGPHLAAVVSQGCRPVGEPFTVTEADGPLVRSLAGQPAFDRLSEVVQQASEPTRALMANGLHVGVVIDEQRDTFERGDFLIRNLIGVDRSNGGLAVGGGVEVGTTLQFQVRDAGSADEDLRALLGDATVEGAPDGALLFTCNGRGHHLFGVPDHDASAVAERLADPVRPALGGMFCAGEIGPVGGRSFLHGFTASIALFRD